MELDAIKARVRETIDESKAVPLALSEKIHANPEYGFEEFQASAWLTEAFEQEGFEVTRGIADLPTAFRAEYRGGDGPTITFLAEYDALPGVGHGCGHNLICTSAFAAATALKKAWPDFPGTIVVMGTPAEEGGGGKILMIDRGAFEGIDMSMMYHPNHITMVNNPSLSAATIDFTFTGRASHSALAPQKGINAADAAMLFFAGVNAFRQHILPDARMHGYIKEAGLKPNIVPYLSKVQFMVRAERLEYMEEVVERVMDIARGAALMTGATMESDRGLTYYDYRHSATLGSLAQSNFDALGVETTPVTRDTARASGDAGNVSHIMPHLGITVAVADHPIRGHSDEMVAAAISPIGQNAMVTAAKIMATTACDIFSDTTLLDAAKAEQKIAVSPQP